MNRLDPITALIAVEHILLQEGIRLLLADQEDIQIIGETSDVYHTLHLVEALHPNILLLDVQLLAMSGLNSLSIIHALSPTTKILLLSNEFEETVITEVLQLGAQGYLPKTATPRDLVRAMRMLNAGEFWAPRKILSQIIERLRQQVASLQGSPPAPRDPLTNREHEIVQGVLQGLTNREISTSLGISEKTVKTHLGNIFRKLNVHRRGHLRH